VTPAKDMLVRPGQHVSGDGRIYHPYLAQWEKYWDVSLIYIEALLKLAATTKSLGSLKKQKC